MKSRWALNSSTKIKLFLTRFRRLPTAYWAILASIFGVVDFLTWSILSDVQPPQRIYLTIGLAIGAFVFTLVFVLLWPSEKEATTHARSLTRMAREAFSANNYTEALRLLGASTHLDGNNAASWSLLGRTLGYLGRFDEAIPPLTRGIEISQIKGNIHILLISRSLAHYYLGNLGQALDDLDQILRDNPIYSEALRLRATIWFRLKRFDNALNDINTALENRPNYLCAHAIKAVILKEKGKKRAAIEELRQCDTLKPKDAVDFYCLSIAHSYLGTPEHALEFLQTSIQHDPKCAPRAAKDPLFHPIRENPNFNAVVLSFQTTHDTKQKVVTRTE